MAIEWLPPHAADPTIGGPAAQWLSGSALERLSGGAALRFNPLAGGSGGGDKGRILSGAEAFQATAITYTMVPEKFLNLDGDTLKAATLGAANGGGAAKWAGVVAEWTSLCGTFFGGDGDKAMDAITCEVRATDNTVAHQSVGV